MKRLLCPLLCLLLLTGCARQPQSPQEEMLPTKAADSQDITLTVGRRLPLPVTEDGIRDYYESPEGFDRQIKALWGWEEGFCVCSVPVSDARGGTSQGADARFDYIYTATGCCYTLLEGAYSSQDVESISPGSIVLTPEDIPLSTISAGLNPSLVDTATGEPVSGGRVSAAAVSVEPRAYALEWWPLMPELWDGGPLAIPGGDGSAAPQSLNGVYTGADTLDLLFDSLGQGLFPEVQITYAPEVRELTLLCRNAPLNCQPSGGNLFIDGIRTEARGADTAVICAMTASGPSPYATSLQVEQKQLDDLDRGEVLLRLTFHSPVG